jgi:hypothetical protein
MNVPTANIAADAPVLLRENAPKYRYASAFMIENLIARDAEEGLKAFIDKREPKWEDR